MSEDASVDQQLQDLKGRLDQMPSRSDIERMVDSKIGGLESKLRTAIDQKIDQGFAGFTIQSGPGIQVSGAGRNITVAWIVPAPPQWTGTGICNDDGTISITLTSS
jgi:hypothetical protein